MAQHFITNNGLTAIAAALPGTLEVTQFKVGTGKTIDLLPTLNPTTLIGALSVTPIKPGSVSVTVPGAGGEVFTDDGAGNLSGDDGGIGSVNYNNGSITLTFGTPVAHPINIPITSLFAGFADVADEAKGVIPAGVTVFTGVPAATTYNTKVTKGSLVVKLNGMPIGGDDGLGNIVGANITSGTINYVSGAITINFGAGNPGGAISYDYQFEHISTRTELVDPLTHPSLGSQFIQIVGATVIDVGKVNFTCVCDETLGDFEVNEVGLFLSDNTMFSMCPTDGPVFKRAELPGRLGNRLVFNVQITFDNFSSLVNFSLLNIQPDEWQNLPTPAVTPDDPEIIAATLATQTGLTPVGAEGLTPANMAMPNLSDVAGSWLIAVFHGNGLQNGTNGFRSASPRNVRYKETVALTEYAMRRVFEVEPSTLGPGFEVYALRTPPSGVAGTIEWDFTNHITTAMGYGVAAFQVKNVSDIIPRFRRQHTYSASSDPVMNLSTQYDKSLVLSIVTDAPNGGDVITPASGTQLYNLSLDDVPALAYNRYGLSWTLQVAPGNVSLDWTEATPGNPSEWATVGLELVWLGIRGTLVNGNKTDPFEVGRKTVLTSPAGFRYGEIEEYGSRYVPALNQTEIIFNTFLFTALNQPQTADASVLSSELSADVRDSTPSSSTNSEWENKWLPTNPVDAAADIAVVSQHTAISTDAAYVPPSGDTVGSSTVQVIPIVPTPGGATPQKGDGIIVFILTTNPVGAFKSRDVRYGARQVKDENLGSFTGSSTQNVYLANQRNLLPLSLVLTKGPTTGLNYTAIDSGDGTLLILGYPLLEGTINYETGHLAFKQSGGTHSYSASYVHGGEPMQFLGVIGADNDPPDVGNNFGLSLEVWYLPYLPQELEPNGVSTAAPGGGLVVANTVLKTSSVSTRKEIMSYAVVRNARNRVPFNFDLKGPNAAGDPFTTARFMPAKDRSLLLAFYGEAGNTAQITGNTFTNSNIINHSGAEYKVIGLTTARGILGQWRTLGRKGRGQQLNINILGAKYAWLLACVEIEAKASASVVVAGDQTGRFTPARRVRLLRRYSDDGETGTPKSSQRTHTLVVSEEQPAAAMGAGPQIINVALNNQNVVPGTVKLYAGALSASARQIGMDLGDGYIYRCADGLAPWLDPSPTTQQLAANLSTINYVEGTAVIKLNSNLPAGYFLYFTYEVDDLGNTLPYDEPLQSKVFNSEFDGSNTTVELEDSIIDSSVAGIDTATQTSFLNQLPMFQNFWENIWVPCVSAPNFGYFAVTPVSALKKVNYTFIVRGPHARERFRVNRPVRFRTLEGAVYTSVITFAEMRENGELYITIAHRFMNEWSNGNTGIRSAVLVDVGIEGAPVPDDWKHQDGKRRIGDFDGLPLDIVSRRFIPAWTSPDFTYSRNAGTNASGEEIIQNLHISDQLGILSGLIDIAYALLRVKAEPRKNGSVTVLADVTSIFDLQVLSGGTFSHVFQARWQTGSSTVDGNSTCFDVPIWVPLEKRDRHSVHLLWTVTRNSAITNMTWEFGASVEGWML